MARLRPCPRLSLLLLSITNPATSLAAPEPALPALPSTTPSSRNTAAAEPAHVTVDWQQSAPFCRSAQDDQILHLKCPEGGVISSIAFASYGTPGGSCGARWLGSCHAPTTLDYVKGLCIQKNSCELVPSHLADPCFGTHKHLVVDFVCATPDGRAVPHRRNTVPTYQIVPNPELRRGRRMHDAAFKAAASLDADLVRIAPWNPYPLLMVPELMPPEGSDANVKTFWNFSYMDPFIEDAAAVITQGPSGPKPNKRPILCLCDTPGWLWHGGGVLNVNTTNADTGGPIPNEHGNGTLVDPTGKQAGEYFARIAGYYLQGGFTDEGGSRFQSKYTLPIRYWEVLNEINDMDKVAYTAIYDSTVEEIRKVAPDMTFIGLALEQQPLPQMRDWFAHFLNPANHRPAALPLQWVSFHYYTQYPPGNWTALFETADVEMQEVVQAALDLREQLAPQVKFDMNEVGCMSSPLNDEYWSACGAWWVYMWATAGKLGVDAVGSSQLVGYPAMDGFNEENPEVTMISYDSNPRPNARFWALKLIIDTFGSDKDQPPHSLHRSLSDQPQNLFVQAYSLSQGGAVVLLVNKLPGPLQVTLAGAKGRRMDYVDRLTAYGPPQSTKLLEDAFQLQGFAVAVVHWADGVPSAGMVDEETQVII